MDDLRNIAKAAPACPCCQFRLPDDLLSLHPVPKPRRRDSTDDAAVTAEGCAGMDATNNVTQPTTHAMMDPREAWNQLREKNHRLVDTHGHAHLERESASLYQVEEQVKDTLQQEGPEVITLTCAVEPSDWEACLLHAAQSTNRIAALGIHPWYLEGITEDGTWLIELERLLQTHPGCIVGEIGLCKMARFVRTYVEGKQAALALQREIFAKQLGLAAKYQRPVSIHCVNQQGVLLDAFKELMSFPPCIALHSFSGTAHQVQQLLKWEETLKLPERLLYFGFSHCVNYAMCSSEKSRQQGRHAIRQVPRDRLLAESDVHCTDNVAVGTSGAVAFLAWALEVPIEEVATLTTRNGLNFLKKATSHPISVESVSD